MTATPCPPFCKRRPLRRPSAWALLALALLTGAATWPAAAREVYINNYRLHIDCRGSGAPTVVFDAGLGGSALEWVLVRAALGDTTRVCLYDRAGYGASDVGANPRSSSRIANELFLLLDGAGEQPPYILVGHSFGGYNMQLFARRYPYLTAGLVLVDASHPEQVERFLAPPLGLSTAPSSRAGVVRFAEPPPPHPLLPDSIRRRIFSTARSAKFRRTLGAETLAFRDSARELASALPLADLPLIVLTRGRLDGPATPRRRLLERLWLELQGELAAQSAQAVHLIARNSGHALHVEQPGLVAYAVAMLVQRHRAGVAASGGEAGPNVSMAGFALGEVQWMRDELSVAPAQVAGRATCVRAEEQAACATPTGGAP